MSSDRIISKAFVYLTLYNDLVSRDLLKSILMNIPILILEMKTPSTKRGTLLVCLYPLDVIVCSNFVVHLGLSFKFYLFDIFRYKRARMLGDWRKVIDSYVDEFNVSVLHDEGLYLDLLENMSTDIWQSLVGTLFCMAIICLVFMNHIFVVLIATSVIASIMIGGWLI